MRPSIVPIVEGHSEVKSVPVLMRRFLNQHGIYDVVIEKPIRVKRQQVIKEGQLERAIARALLRPNCGAIVIILDADDDCPKELAPSLLKRARKASPSTLVSVVLPQVRI